MRRNEIIVTLILVLVSISGISYEQYRGASKTAEVIVVHDGKTPFDAVKQLTLPTAPSNEEPTIRSSNNDPSHDLVLNYMNTADLNALKQLPGIGEVYAQRILDERSRLGSFTAIEQLQEIKGIGQARYSDIVDYIRTNKPSLREKKNTYPSTFRAAPMDRRPPTVQQPTKPLSLNQATIDDLKNVSGIGDSIANEILLVRQKNGGFRSWDEVDQISGIGESRLNRLKEHFTVP